MRFVWRSISETDEAREISEVTKDDRRGVSRLAEPPGRMMTRMRSDGGSGRVRTAHPPAAMAAQTVARACRMAS